MQEQVTRTAADLIKQYVLLRDTIQQKQEAFDKEIKPYTEGMELIENLLAEEIIRLGGQSIKTAHGTAYRQMTTSFRVADRDAWFDWVLKNKRTDCLTTHVAKDAIKEVIDTTKKEPPGLTITQIWKTNIRRADQ